VQGHVAHGLVDRLGEVVALHRAAADLLRHCGWLSESGALWPTPRGPSNAAI
jgi:hypothetical protein